MKNKIFMGLAAVAMVAFLSSCGKAPVDQENALKAAIDSAKIAQADVYVPAEFAAIQDSLKDCTTKMEAQKSKLFKKYGPVKAKLEATLALANQVKANAATKKEEVKKEVETLMTDIKAVNEDNKKCFVKAPRGKEGKEVMEQIKTEMATIETSVAETQALYDKGSYMEALNKIKSAKDSADKINTELKDAIAKVSGAKKAAVKK